MFFIIIFVLQTITTKCDQQARLTPIQLIEQDLLQQLRGLKQGNLRILNELNLSNVLWKPIQIQFQFMDNPEIEVEKIKFVEQVLEVSQIFFGKHIMVRDQGEAIQFGNNKTTCAGIEIPEVYRSSNYSADLVIFVQLLDDNQTNKFAYSGPCKITSYDLRPIFGITVWNTYFINTTEITASYFQQTTSTAIHELIHVLGFISILYPYYYDSSTYQNFNLSLQKDTNGHLILETPRLQNISKTYFQCDKAQGAIMENEGGAATEENHFERTIYFNELMTGSKMNGQLILSDFTFQLIQDMGFYRLLEYHPDKMNWGKGKGCDFLFLSCDVLQEQNSYDEFCNEKGYHCSYDNYGIGQCGYDQLSDSCTYFNIRQGLDCRNSDQQQSNEQKDFFIQTNAIQSSNSLCLDIIYTSQSTFTTNIDQSCFQYNCKDDEIYILLNQNVNFPALIHCPKDDIISLIDLNYNIQCPKNQKLICQSKNNCENFCNQRGYCINQQCTCIKGFAGQNCELDCTGYRNGFDCVQSCNENQYQDEKTFYCLNCSGNCISCTSISKCQICDQGYQLIDGFCDPFYEIKKTSYATNLIILIIQLFIFQI